MGSKAGRRTRGLVGAAGAPAGSGKREREDAENGERERRPGLTPGNEVWPGWARLMISCALLFHIGACVAGAVGAPPSSALARRIADLFTPYFDLLDLGYSYRFYSEPPPTPVMRAMLHFEDGRLEEVIRLPGLNIPGPRMRHQRQLALANALFMDVQQAKERTEDRSQSQLAPAYARHLCRKHPGCRSVTIHLMQHLIPDPDQVRSALSLQSARRFDLFGESLFSTPERIGDYSCGAF